MNNPLQRCAGCAEPVAGVQADPLFSPGAVTYDDNGGAPCSVTVTCGSLYPDPDAIILLSLQLEDGTATPAAVDDGMHFDGTPISQPLYCSENGTYYIDGYPDTVLTGVIYCECKISSFHHTPLTHLTFQQAESPLRPRNYQQLRHLHPLQRK